MQEDKNKAESKRGFGTPTQREQGQPQPTRGSLNLIQDIKKEELKMPQRICTFDEMCQDDAVRQPLEITQILSLLGLSKGKYEGNPDSKESQIAADFLNYTIHNMTSGTWFEFCNNAVSSLKYGFSLFNIVMERRNHGEYAGSLVLKKLAPRSQASLYGWMYDDKGRELLGMVQRPTNINTSLAPSRFGGVITSSKVEDVRNAGFTPIFNKNLIRFTHNATNNNPQGNSPLIACFEAWAEKSIIEQYEVIGVSKDLGGLVVVRAKQELLQRAKDPDTYPNDYKAYLQLENQIANIHAGKQSYIILSDEMEQGNYSYDIDLKGIDGGGKQYKTSEIIEQKRKAIYNVFGAGFLLLGQDSHGSYNLSSTGKIVHSFYVERNTEEFVSVLNADLAPKILTANNIFLSHKNMPKFVPANPDQLSLDDAGKFIQRAASVQKATPEAIAHIYRLAGLPTEGIEGLDFSSKGESRAGESEGSSGTGDSQQAGSNSATNVENSGVSKSSEEIKKFTLDPSFETDNQYVAVDQQTGEHIFIDKEE